MKEQCSIQFDDDYVNILNSEIIVENQIDTSHQTDQEDI